MDKQDFARLRRHYPMLEKHAYFETAATGAIPDYVYQTYAAYQQARYTVGGDSSWAGASTFEMVEWAKARLAEMLGCGAHSIAFGENTSQVFGQFAGGLTLAPGDNVILTDTAFLSMAYAWDLQRQTRGVEIRLAPSDNGCIPPESLFRLADEKTRVISLCHVESDTGFRHDLARIGAFCREQGILLAVDAAQSAGVMPVDVEGMGVDFLAGNNYKWMQGYCGVGYGYYGPRALERLTPRAAGWKSHRGGIHPCLPQSGGESFPHLELYDDARRFEFGYPNAPGVCAIGQVAQAYTRLGSKAIEDHVLSLGEQVRQCTAARPGLRIWGDYPPGNRSQIVILTADRRYTLTNEALRSRGVFACVRDGQPYGDACALRLGLHYYNSAQDVERLFAALDACRRP